MDEPNGKNGKKLNITKLQVGGMIVVALLGAWTTYVNNQSASEEDLRKTVSDQKAMIDKQETMIAELKVLIPQIGKKFDGHEVEFKAMDKKVSKLEGILETMLHMVRIDDLEDMLVLRRPKKESKGFLDKIGLGNKEEKPKPKKKKAGIRTLQMQQRVLPSLDGPIVKEKK